MMLGLLSLRSDQETEYFTEIAKRAVLHGMQVVRFTPFQIIPATEQVRGLLFDSVQERWIQHTFPIPPFIYDRCFYNRTESSRQGKPIVEWLKKRPQTQFLGYGLPDKLQTYSILSHHPATAPYVPYTVEATVENVWKYIWKHKQAALKPVNGSQGNGFCFLSYGRRSIQATLQQAKQTITESFISKEDFSVWLAPILQSQTYMLQPFLSVQDAYGRPFDIRVLLQKNETGIWEEVGRGVRCGNERAVVSNLHAGSQIITYEQWKQSYPKRERLLLEDNIATLLKAVPIALEQSLSPLFEIGLDISVDQNQAVWLLDVNSKPGRRVMLDCKPESADQLYHAPLSYCKYLTLEAQKGADSQ